MELHELQDHHGGSKAREGVTTLKNSRVSTINFFN